MDGPEKLDEPPAKNVVAGLQPVMCGGWKPRQAGVPAVSHPRKILMENQTALFMEQTNTFKGAALEA